MKYRRCYEPHLRDYPDCFQECGCDVCEAPVPPQILPTKCSEVECPECNNMMYEVSRRRYFCDHCKRYYKAIAEVIRVKLIPAGD